MFRNRKIPMLPFGPRQALTKGLGSRIGIASLIFAGLTYHSQTALGFVVDDSTIEIKFYPFDTSKTDITGTQTWSVNKVTISTYSKAEIKQYYGETFLNYDYDTANECDQSDSCSLSDSSEDILEFIDKLFKNYEKPEDAQIRILGNLTVKAGTVVDLKDGISLVVEGGTLTLEGDDEQQVQLKGTSWGGIYLKTGGSANFQYCKITGVDSDYGAIRIETGFNNVTIDNCEISNNQGFYGGGLYINNANPTITNSLITGNNDSALGGGIYMFNANPTLTGNTISENSDASVGGGIYMSLSSPTLTNNVIANNSAQGGGGLFVTLSSNPTLHNTIIANNTGTSAGGGMLFDSASSSTSYNSTISGNLSPSGSALYIDGGSTPSFINSIIYGNGAEEEGDNGSLSQQIFTSSLGSFTNSLVEGGASGDQNINDDPLFSSASTKFGTGGNGVLADWSLQAGSPAINAGTFAVKTSDYEGKDRNFNDVAVDIGAFEFQNNPPAVGGETEDLSITADKTDEDNDVTVQVCSDSTDPENQDLQVIISSLPSLGGKLYQYDSGDKGSEITESSNTLTDIDGFVIYSPFNSSASYEDSFECQIQDQPLDSESEEEEVDESLVAASINKQTITVSVTADNDPPAITTTLESGGSANVNGNYEFIIEAEDPDVEDTGSVLTLTSDRLLTWLTLTNNGDGTFTLSGVPSASDQNQSDVDSEEDSDTTDESTEEVDNTVYLTIKDDEGNSTESSYSINVQAQNELTVTIGETTSGEPNAILELTASGSEGDTVTYNWSISDSNENVVKEGTGTTLNWFPEIEGLYSATVTVTDTEGSLSASDVADISITTGFVDVDDENRTEPTTDDEAAIASFEETDAGTTTQNTNTTILATPDDSSELNRLSQLSLTEDQIGILLSAIASIITTGEVTVTQTNQLLGALDNLIVETSLDVPLTSTQQSTFFTTIETAVKQLSLDQAQLIKIVEVLNEVVIQQGQEILTADQVAELKAAISATQERSFITATSFDATSRKFVKVASAVVDLTSAIETVEIGDLEEDQVKASITTTTLTELQEKLGIDQVVIGFAANSVSFGHGVLLSISMADINGNPLSVNNLSEPISITIPVVVDGALTPQYFNNGSSSWQSDGISNVDSSTGASVSFSTNHLTEFALFSAPVDTSGSEPNNTSKVTDVFEDTKSCFLDSLF